MRHFRIGLLIVLAVLLPVRGALAVTMTCAVGMPVSVAPCATHGAGMSTAVHPSAEPRDEPAAGHDKCPLCAASCSLTPLASAMTPMPEPLSVATVRFPESPPQVASFVAGGPERPPRSI